MLTYPLAAQHIRHRITAPPPDRDPALPVKIKEHGSVLSLAPPWWRLMRALRRQRGESAAPLSESALRRNIGDATIMHQQLLHLAEAAERPNVELQVLPFDAQTFGAAWIGFIILRFDHDSTSDVVYLEGYTDADYLDSPDEVQSYTALWNRLRAAAMG